jgi:hypothetical protein
VPLGRLRDTDAGLATKHSTEHANNFKKNNRGIILGC